MPSLLLNWKMGAHLMLPSHVPSIIITLFFLLIFAQTSYCEDGIDKDYEECRRPFTCGNLTDLSYPFWSDSRPEICGLAGFKLQCRERETPVINITNQEIRILKVNRSPYEITIAIMDFWERACPDRLVNTTINNGDLNYFPGFGTICLFYNCSSRLPDAIPSTNKFACSSVGEAFYATNESERELGIRQCRIRMDFLVPTMALEQDAKEGFIALGNVLRQGFNVPYLLDRKCPDCEESDGTCVTDSTSAFTCFCRDGRDNLRCPAGNERRLKLKVIIGIPLGVIGFLLVCGVIYCSKKIPLVSSVIFSKKMEKNNQDFGAFLENNGILSIKRFTYSEVKKMTNFFKEKLGQGGYGTVYKGKLSDDRLVAVKVLNTSKGREEFINEVASISRTSHVNIVTLLGFCLKGQKRALIYEFMPNGSLEKFICSASILKTDQHLGWTNFHHIAIGIARGLEYLHLRCNTRIVHFDIKPHNVLLDEHFCPKISDFGLAKLCTKKESVVSMLEARGTIGYIAPEVWSRNFGRVSYKSDVYSYGMMVLEMVGGREKDDVGTDHTSEIYFPHWIYRRLELGKECELYGEISMQETEIVRKMMLVGLWCIQTNPFDRPSMTKVIEMLEGSIETINIPPKPFLSSPPRSPLCSFSASSS